VLYVGHSDRHAAPDAVGVCSSATAAPCGATRAPAAADPPSRRHSLAGNAFRAHQRHPHRGLTGPASRTSSGEDLGIGEPGRLARQLTPSPAYSAEMPSLNLTIIDLVAAYKTSLRCAGEQARNRCHVDDSSPSCVQPLRQQRWVIPTWIFPSREGVAGVRPSERCRTSISGGVTQPLLTRKSMPSLDSSRSSANSSLECRQRRGRPRRRCARTRQRPR